MKKRSICAKACKISGKMKSATTVFVVAFDMRKQRKAPREAGQWLCKAFSIISICFYSFFEFFGKNFYPSLPKS